MNNINIIKEISKAIDEKKNFAVVSIISSSGSTPRDSGSKMIVYSDGSIYGSVGGGKLEHLCIKEALNCIEKQENKKVKFSLTPGGLNALCMGEVEVYIEVYTFPIKVFIFGAGHVGFALSKIFDFLSIPYVIIDDRKDLASKTNFPNAFSVVNEKPDKAFNNLEIDKDSYIIIVTRGHSLDKECLVNALKTKASYIGMIGSRSKVKEIFKELNKKKIYPQKDKRVYSPIGVNCGGKTPNEIAVSVACEILSVFYKTDIKHMRDL